MNRARKTSCNRFFLWFTEKNSDRVENIDRPNQTNTHYPMTEKGHRGSVLEEKIRKISKSEGLKSINRRSPETKVEKKNTKDL